MAEDKRNLTAADYSQPPPYNHPHIAAGSAQPTYPSHQPQTYAPQPAYPPQPQYAPTAQYPSQPAVQNVSSSSTSIVVNSSVGPYAQYVPDYMGWSIVTTLFCCLPLGIVGIVLSAMVRDHRYSGDHAAARRLSRGALIVNLIATLCGIALITVLVIVASTGGFYYASIVDYSTDDIFDTGLDV